jgi:hypothetical protein
MDKVITMASKSFITDLLISNLATDTLILIIVGPFLAQAVTDVEDLM